MIARFLENKVIIRGEILGNSLVNNQTYPVNPCPCVLPPNPRCIFFIAVD
jgi:hypothetical protein